MTSEEEQTKKKCKSTRTKAESQRIDLHARLVAHTSLLWKPQGSRPFLFLL